MLRRGVVLRAPGRGGSDPFQQIKNKFTKKALNEVAGKAKAFAKTANAQQVVQSVARTAAAAEQVARAQFSKMQDQFNASSSSQKASNNNDNRSSSGGSSTSSSNSNNTSTESPPFAAFWEFVNSISARVGPHFWKLVESLGVTMTFSLVYYLYSTSHSLMAALESYKENVKRMAMRDSYQREARESVEDAVEDSYANRTGGQHSFGDAGGVTADRDSGTSHGLQRAMSGNSDEDALKQRLQRRDDRRRKQTAAEDGVSYYDEQNAQRLEEDQVRRKGAGGGIETVSREKSRTEMIATSLLREIEEDDIRQQLDTNNHQTYQPPGTSKKAKVEDGNRRKDNRRSMMQDRAQHTQRQMALIAKRKAHDAATYRGMSQEEYDLIYNNSFFFRFGNAPIDPRVTPAAGHNMLSATKDTTLQAYGTTPGQGQLPTHTPNFNEYTNGGFRTAEMAGTAASVHAPTGRYLSGVVTAFHVRCLKRIDGQIGTDFAQRKLENLNRKAPEGFVMDPLSGRFARIETVENSGVFTGGNSTAGNESPRFDFRSSSGSL